MHVCVLACMCGIRLCVCACVCVCVYVCVHACVFVLQNEFVLLNIFCRHATIRQPVGVVHNSKYVILLPAQDAQSLMESKRNLSCYH